jgi:nucleotide-binding universal stress UspA family protein
MNEAALRHTAIMVISVHPVVRNILGHADTYPEDSPLVERSRQAAREATDKSLARLGGARPDSVTVETVTGVPAEVLLAAAADADMIVVGSRGAGGFSRLTMGSVGDQVARHAPCPVVIVPPQDAS